MAKRRRLLLQARDETMLRYGPEVRGLRRLLREARSNLELGIRAEEATAAGVKAASKAAKPELRRSYARAGETFDQVDRDTQVLGGASSDAAVREAAGARRRMAESLADAEGELAQRSVDAESGRAYGVRQRRTEYQGERGKVREEQRDLEGEMGRYASTTFRQLKDADVKLGLERRRIKISLGQLNVSRGNADETRRHNRQTEANARAEERRLRDKADDKKPRFTPLQKRDAHALWDKATVYARALVKSDDPKVKDAGFEAWVQGLTKKGIPPAMARSAITFVRHGGVLPKQRRRLRRDYGLKPKVYGDLERSIDTLTHLGI